MLTDEFLEVGFHLTRNKMYLPEFTNSNILRTTWSIFLVLIFGRILKKARSLTRILKIKSENNISENLTVPGLLYFPKTNMVYVVTSNPNTAQTELPKLNPNHVNVEEWMERLKLLPPLSIATCIFCKRLFTVEKVVEHVHLKHSKLGFTCNKCGKPCSSQSALALHKRSHDEERNHECKVCSKRFKSKYVLKYHMKCHSEKREWVCHICQASFKYKSYLDIHVRRHSNTGEFKCNLCDKKYSYASILNEHFRNTHATNIECNICKEVFPNYYYLQKHSIVHKVPICHVCPICKKIFNLKHLVTKHLKVVHGNKDKFVCDICGKTCSCGTSLRDHKLIHSGIKPFECHDCGKKFNTKNRIRIHVLVHTGIKPHSCTMCDKKFTQRSTLVIHIRSHTGEKPYKCDLCAKAFVSRTLLNNHKKNHD